MQKKLMQKALAPWPRRDANLLEINCGEGDLLKTYWRSGFEIAATEADADMRRKAFEKNIPGLEIRAASDDDLPFEDDYFDWAILNVRHNQKDQLRAAIEETLRVGKRGIMIAFWNNCSLAALMAALRRKQGVLPPFAVSYRAVLDIARSAAMGRISLCSTLWMPEIIWRRHCHLETVNSWLTALPFGSWCILRMDFALGRPVTGLPLHIPRQFNSIEPALEYSDKRIMSQKHSEE